jgi:hypothetical protein
LEEEVEDGKAQQDQQPSNTLSRAATVINNISHSILFKMTLSKVLSRQNEIITAARLGSVIAGVYFFFVVVYFIFFDMTNCRQLIGRWLWFAASVSPSLQSSD